MFIPSIGKSIPFLRFSWSITWICDHAKACCVVDGVLQLGNTINVLKTSEWIYWAHFVGSAMLGSTFHTNATKNWRRWQPLTHIRCKAWSSVIQETGRITVLFILGGVVNLSLLEIKCSFLQANSHAPELPTTVETFGSIFTNIGHNSTSLTRTWTPGP